MRVEQDDRAAADIIAGALGVVLSPPYVGLVVRDERGKVHGAAVVNDFTGANAEVTVVGRCWTVRIVRDISRYILHRLGCRRVTARTRASNAEAIHALEVLGFKREGVAREWFDGEDAIVFGLLASEQRIVR